MNNRSNSELDPTYRSAFSFASWEDVDESAASARSSSSASSTPAVRACERSGTRAVLGSAGNGERAGNGSVGQTWQGSFSAVSSPNFASKYALESSRPDLHNALLCTTRESHLLKILFLKNARIYQNLRKFRVFLLSCKILQKVW